MGAYTVHGMWHGSLELVLIKIHRIFKEGNAFFVKLSFNDSYYILKQI